MEIKTFKTKNKRYREDYLDLTTPDYLKSKRMQYRGFKQVLRPYKKWALGIAIFIAALGILPFLPFFVTIPLAIKFLGWFG